MNATIANPANLSGRSSNGRAAAARREPPSSGALGRHRWAANGFARLATAALLLLVIFGGYRAFDPFGSKSPSSIPAAVFSAATPAASVASPTPTRYPSTDHPIFGVWKWVFNSNPLNCCSYAIFERDGTYVDAEVDSMGPGVTRVSIGQWRATGERTVELVTYGQQTAPMDFMFEPDFAAPDSVLTGDPVTTFRTLEIDATGDAFTSTGYYEPRNADGSVIVHFPFEYTISPQGVRVAGSWETQLPSPTPTS